MVLVIRPGAIGEILKSEPVRADLLRLGHAVAEGIDARDSHGRQVPVMVGSYTTDRAAVGVTLAHPGGLPIEAKHGTLVRAASEVGLEVKARPKK